MSGQMARPLAGQISLWIQDQVRMAGAKGLVVGLSGGIDSAVVASLARMACGDNVLALLMPCHSDPASASDAMAVAKKIGVKTHTADLTAACDALVAQVPHAEGIELANVAPRLRMTALYCAAQTHGYLVAGTSNKTESMIGYFTKWGDGASDMRPIGNLYKYQVRRLAAELGIPQEIIEKQPTADLWLGQTDENEIGMAYDELDALLQALDAGKIGQHSPEAVQRVKKMIARSEHKRCAIPTFQPDGLL